MGALREVIDSANRDVGVTADVLIARASDESGRDALNARSALLSYFFGKAEASGTHAELGNFASAMQCASQAVQVAETANLVFLRAFAESLPGRVHLRKGETVVAIPFLEQGLALARDADFPNAFIHAAGELGHAYNLVQRSADAILLLERAWSFAEDGNFLHLGVISLMHLADAYDLTGQHAKALAAIDRALSITRASGYRVREAWALYLQGNILGRDPAAKGARARQAYQVARTLADELGMRPLVAQCSLALGSLPIGGVQEQRFQLEVAVTMFREMDIKYWLERAELALTVL
jgi:tetratricopeptide (TPR) repeat protein